jgi:hypothetical protein
MSEETKYCAEFARSNCCDQLPCSRLDGRYVLTKSHDYDLTLSKDVPNAMYLVQDREPHGRILSTAELIKQNLGARWPIENREHAAWWLAERAVYAVGFRLKWVKAAPERAVVLEYDDLCRDPVSALRRVTQALGRTFPDAGLEDAAARALRRRAGHDVDHAPRDLQDAMLLPPDLLAAHTRAVRRRTPAFLTESVYLAKPAPEFDGLFQRAARVAHIETADALEWARRDARTENRWYLMQLASRLDRLKAFDAAGELLEVLAQRDFQIERVRMRQSYVAERRGDIQQALRFAEEAATAAVAPLPETLSRVRELRGLGPREGKLSLREAG